jgi:maltooligosyltrehalose trehalohydrolase
MMNTEFPKRSVGATTDENGNVLFRVWSPQSTSMQIVLEDGERIAMKREGEYWTETIKNTEKEFRYKFLVNNQDAFPDPASIFQPKGVHGSSSFIDLNSFEWGDEDWINPSLSDYIIYELHTGTFSPEGNFKGIEKKLDHFINLGINAIEIMPVAQFPGERNWGYDGVFPFAVQNSYGGPRGLQELVNACHRKGIAVILDVVYNHLGPEGNYLEKYGPYFTDKYKTPWGRALNFDDAWCDGVRNYFIENALMWFRDFHIDALRLDAVHAIKDFGAEHILESLKKRKDSLEKITDRRYFLIAEVDLNDPKYIDPLEKGGYGMDAQWIDEFHHSLRVAAGGERKGYYEDFNGLEHLARAYKHAYVFDGQYSPHRKKTFGKKALSNPGDQFVVFSQNHDQVGNRMFGERSSILFSFEMQKLIAGAIMVSPYIPLLFMGEEWSETNPFLYFVSHSDPLLVEAVREGRKKEFQAFHSQGAAPDPFEESSFQNSKLQWHLLDSEKHQVMFRFYQELIALRKRSDCLSKNNRKNLNVEFSREKNYLIVHRWHKDNYLVCMMNFSSENQFIKPPDYYEQWYKLFDSAATNWLGNTAAHEEVVNAGTSIIDLAANSFLIFSNQPK